MPTPLDSSALVPEQNNNTPSPPGAAALKPTAVEKRVRFTVAVVDDEPDVHLSIGFILEEAEEFEPAGCYHGGEEALSGILSKPPDVVLMDIRLPDVSGIECTRRLTATLPGLRVVMISALDDRRTMEEAIQAGCHGYLTKPFGASQCLAMLRCALSTQRAGAVTALASADQCPLRRRKGQTICFHISTREVEVLEALTEGLLYKQIEDKLRVSESLAHKLVNRVFRKLRVHNRQEAVSRWLICSRCSNWIIRGVRNPGVSVGSAPPPDERETSV
jgi:two-component system, NarL family, response regulator LiaR